MMEFLGWACFALSMFMAFGPVVLLFAFAAGEIYHPGVTK